MATRQKRQRLQQTTVPGAIEIVQEIEDAAHAQHNREQDVKEARGELAKAEIHCIAVMKKHSKTVYRTASGYVATYRPGKEKVKVRKAVAEKAPRRGRRK